MARIVNAKVGNARTITRAVESSVGPTEGLGFAGLPMLRAGLSVQEYAPLALGARLLEPGQHLLNPSGQRHASRKPRFGHHEFDHAPRLSIQLHVPPGQVSRLTQPCAGVE